MFYTMQTTAYEGANCYKIHDSENENFESYICKLLHPDKLFT